MMKNNFKAIRKVIYTVFALCFALLLLLFFRLTFFAEPSSAGDYLTAAVCGAALLLLIALLIFVSPACETLYLLAAGLKDGGKTSLSAPHSPAYNSPREFADGLREEILSEDKANYQAEIEKKQIVLSTLQKQINPHFLYNTLDCIRGEALIRDQDELADIIGVLSSFFRYSISHKGNIVTVYDEIQNVRNYYKIQQFRFAALEPLEIGCPEGIETVYDILIPKMTLQPLVENAIHHGLSAKLDSGHIALTFEKLGNDLIIRCTDNGIGIEPDRLNAINDFIKSEPDGGLNAPATTGTGIGLRNVSRRISLLFGKPYGITVYSLLGKGTSIEVRIPRKIRSADGGANG